MFHWIDPLRAGKPKPERNQKPERCQSCQNQTLTTTWLFEIDSLPENFKSRDSNFFEICFENIREPLTTFFPAIRASENLCPILYALLQSKVVEVNYLVIKRHKTRTKSYLTCWYWDFRAPGPSFFLKVPRMGVETGIFWFSFNFSL